MIDDAKTFGRIAAANALSDVWAMGGNIGIAIKAKIVNGRKAWCCTGLA
jgi:selenophosphate synthase